MTREMILQAADCGPRPARRRATGYGDATRSDLQMSRSAIEEWIARGDESLEHLVAHVLVHEVGHHFGLSDEAMHALEDEGG